MSRGVIRVGLAQYVSSGSRSESLSRLSSILRRRRVEADVIVLPEYADTAPPGRGSAGPAPLEGNAFVEGLAGLAAEYSAYIVAGVLEEHGGCSYSSVVLVEPSGGLRVVHRKYVLFDALGYRESSVLCPGAAPPRPFSLGGLPAGALVCFELRFPELARGLAASGAKLLVVPAAWYPGPGKEEQLRFLAQARASENTVYLALADQAAPGFAGRSMLVDPMGHVVLDLGPAPGYGEAEADLDLLREARERLPLLEIAARRGLVEFDHPEEGEEEAGGDPVGEA